MIAFLVLLVGAVVAIGLIGLLTDVGDDDGGSSAASTTIDVSLTEFSIDGQFTAPAGPVTLAVTNVGSVEHNLVVRDLGTEHTDAPGRWLGDARPRRSTGGHLRAVLRGGRP